jgi:hypothetical protein
VIAGVTTLNDRGRNAALRPEAPTCGARRPDQERRVSWSLMTTTGPSSLLPYPLAAGKGHQDRRAPDLGAISPLISHREISRPSARRWPVMGIYVFFWMTGRSCSDSDQQHGLVLCSGSGRGTGGARAAQRVPVAGPSEPYDRDELAPARAAIQVVITAACSAVPWRGGECP